MISTFYLITFYLLIFCNNLKSVSCVCLDTEFGYVYNFSEGRENGLSIAVSYLLRSLFPKNV